MIRDKLAVRIAALYDREEYNQRPAFEEKRRIYGALKIQTPIPGRATLVNFADAERDANEGQARTLSDTDLRVGVGLMERAGLLVRLADAPASLTVRLEGGLFQAADPAFEQFVATAGLTSKELEAAFLALAERAARRRNPEA